jgi:hypothetical protein
MTENFKKFLLTKGNFQGKFQQNVLPIGNYPADEDKDDHNDDDQAFDSVKTAIFSVLFV